MTARNFDEMFEYFTSLLNGLKFNFNLSKVDQLIDKYNATECLSENDKKIAWDQSFRQYLITILKKKSDIKTIECYINFCIELCKKEISSVTLPIVVLSDTFDVSTLDKSEQLFYYVENNVDVWKQPMFFTSSKNNLLRMCNDLLRRLSRSQNTVFCGRILLFLAKFFPFSERSGLNIISEFNVENVTEFGGDEEMEIDVPDEEKTDENEEKSNEDKGKEPEQFKVNFNFYKKFWSLQDFFRNPTQCYNKVSWKMFTTYSETVLEAFKSYKLDELQSSLNPSGDYFAKYLTNQKLLDLQLSDSSFRRYILLQFLITFQYFTSTVKSRGEGLELKPEQEKWIKETTETVYSLIKQTPNNGKQFSQVVKMVLKGDEHWNQWKNDGCPPLKTPNGGENDGEPVAKKVKTIPKLPGDMLKEAAAHGQVLMGNAELTRLWNTKDNLEICKSAERDFMPSIEQYFEEAIEQLDPAAMVEEEYKKVNESGYAWRALRLLSRKCPLFFLNTYQQEREKQLPGAKGSDFKISDFIQYMIKKSIVREKPTPQGQNNGVDAEDPRPEGIVVKEEKEDDWEEALAAQNKETNNLKKSDKIPLEYLDQIAPLVLKDWKKLGLKLGYTENEIALIASSEENTTEEQKARYLLKIYNEDDDDATPENLAYTLEGLGLIEAARILQPSTE